MAEPIAGPVAALCFSSAGELDVLLPLFCAWGIEDFKIYAFRGELLAKVREDSFYGHVVAGRLEDRVVPAMAANKIGRWLQFIRNSLRVFREIAGDRTYFFEYGNSGREKNLLVAILVATGRGKRILFHPHGHAVTPASAYAPRRWPRITRLALLFGARIIRLDGSGSGSGFLAARYPILERKWIEYVRASVKPVYRDHVVILSRDVHPAYLLAENRQVMIRDAVSVLRRHFPDAKVVLRAHPREFFDARRILVDGVEIEVTYENTYSVVRDARVAVSFWTSAFFQCLALEVPVAEYHLPHDRFVANYPAGSTNAEFISCCRSKQELDAFVAAVAAATPRSVAS
jgi:hypothetical protein